jgi:hypothetical protein
MKKRQKTAIPFRGDESKTILNWHVRIPRIGLSIADRSIAHYLHTIAIPDGTYCERAGSPTVLSFVCTFLRLFRDFERAATMDWAEGG